MVAPLAISLLVLVMSGCGSGTIEPDGLELTDETKSGSKVPATAESDPDEADPLEEPEAFIEHFIGLVNESRNTLDPEPFLAYSDPDCKSCHGVAELLGELDAAGGGYEGDSSQTVEEVVLDSSSDPPIYLVTLSRTSHELIQSADGERTSIDDEVAAYDFELRKKEGEGWIVLEYTKHAG